MMDEAPGTLGPFTDNSRVRIDGLAEDGRRIAETVVALRPGAVVEGPARAWRLVPLHGCVRSSATWPQRSTAAVCAVQ